jgi:hypothetical protein
MIKKIKLSIVATVSAGLLFSGTSWALSEEAFFEKRTALIIKHSHQDVTFDMMQNEQSFSREYWRWRLDQYLYGQYPEYQPIYDAYTEGKKFGEIYALPDENLGPAWQEPASLPDIPQGYFTDNLPGNTHTGWHKLIGDTLYIVYQGHLTDPYVASYNVKTHKWSGPFKAGHSTLSKNDRKIDSHGRPIIEVDSQGYIHIVFGGHGGEREDGLNPMSIDTPHAGGRMLHVVSAKPHDLTKFIEKDDISPFASYAKSYRMANGDIYFFTRAGTHKSPWLYYKMKRGSQTFEAPVKITWPTVNVNDPMLVDTHYINPVKVSDTEIVITSLWHACNFKEVHDKTHYNRLNAYFMRLDTSTDTFYNIKNEKLTLPLTLASTNQYTLAYDSQKAKETSFGTRPLVLDDGSYALAYEARGEGYREWRMARFNDGEWSHGHPMPGTVNRTLSTKEGKQVKSVQHLNVLGDEASSSRAAVVYRDTEGQSTFAIAKRVSKQKDGNQNWQVEEVVFAAPQAKLRVEPVLDESGNTVALVVNVRRGVSQRLYLWHKGEFRANH